MSLLNILLFLLGSWGIVGLMIATYYIYAGKAIDFLESQPFFITWLIKLKLISNNTILFG